MKRVIIIALAFPLCCAAQSNRQLSIAFTNFSTAMPFGGMKELVTVLHPGVMAGYSYNLKNKTKHDWFHGINAGYFYHRYVQHGIILSTDIGYRYKFSGGWSAQSSLGAGYLHSIPATAQLELQPNGEYKNGKGFGRSQALASFDLGISKQLDRTAARPVKIFITYRQLLQFPFINEYVPILPYNNLLIGIAAGLHKNK